MDGGQLTLNSDAAEGTGSFIPLSQLRENVTSVNGGAIYCGASCGFRIADTLIYSNSTAQRGGGIYAGSMSTSLIYNTLMVGNSADTAGNAIRVFSAGTRMEIVQSTIVDKLFMSNSIVQGGVSTGQVVRYSDIAGGYPGIGNIMADPRFIDIANVDFRLGYGSPCTNAGTVIAWITNDCMGATRPIGQYDMGAYEYNGAVYDTDGDTMVDQWEAVRGLDPTNAADAYFDPDGDFSTNICEYLADTNPRNSNDYFRIANITSTNNTNIIEVLSSSRRAYSLARNDDIAADAWTKVAGQTNLLGSGAMFELIDTNDSPVRAYRVSVGLPE